MGKKVDYSVGWFPWPYLLLFVVVLILDTLTPHYSVEERSTGSQRKKRKGRVKIKSISSPADFQDKVYPREVGDICFKRGNQAYLVIAAGCPMSFAESESNE